MYELLFSSQQPKAKDFRRHRCNVLFPRVRQQLSNKLHAMEIEDLANRVQALEFTNEEHQQKILRLNEKHRQVIEEKDAAIALLNNDLQDREYENVALRAQRDVYQSQVRDLIINRHLPRTKDPGKDNIAMIIEKNTAPEEDEFYQYPYYIARIQRQFISTKRRWFKAQYPHHRFIIVGVDNTNSIHAFNRFEEKGYIGRDLPRDVLYALPTPAIQE